MKNQPADPRRREELRERWRTITEELLALADIDPDRAAAVVRATEEAIRQLRAGTFFSNRRS